MTEQDARKASVEAAMRERQAVLDALNKNRQLRGRLHWDLDQARSELAALLDRGSRVKWPAKKLTVSAMARAAGISRETAYRFMRRTEDS